MKDTFKETIERIMFMQCTPQNTVEHDILINALFALNNQVKSGGVVYPEERARALTLLMVRAGVGKLISIFGSKSSTEVTIAKNADAADGDVAPGNPEPDDLGLTKEDMERVACVACGAGIGCSCIVPKPGVLGVAVVDGRYFHIWRRKLALMERARMVDAACKGVGDAVAEHAGGLARAAAYVDATQGRQDAVREWQLSMADILSVSCLACYAIPGDACVLDGKEVFVRTSDEHTWAHEMRLSTATLARVEHDQGATDELAERRRAAVAKATEAEPLFVEVTSARRVELDGVVLSAEEIGKIASSYDTTNPDKLNQGWEKSVAIHPDELEQINDERKYLQELRDLVCKAAAYHTDLGSKYEARGNATGAAQLRAVGNLLWSINNERTFVGILPDVPTEEPEINLETAGLRTRIQDVVERELKRYGSPQEPAEFVNASILIAGAVADMLEGRGRGGGIFRSGGVAGREGTCDGEHDPRWTCLDDQCKHRKGNAK